MGTAMEYKMQYHDKLVHNNYYVTYYPFLMLKLQKSSLCQLCLTDTLPLVAILKERVGTNKQISESAATEL